MTSYVVTTLYRKFTVEKQEPQLIMTEAKHGLFIK